MYDAYRRRDIFAFYIYIKYILKYPDYLSSTATYYITGLELVLAMARNLSIGTSRKIDSKGDQKSRKVQQMGQEG